MCSGTSLYDRLAIQYGHNINFSTKHWIGYICKEERKQIYIIPVSTWLIYMCCHILSCVSPRKVFKAPGPLKIEQHARLMSQTLRYLSGQLLHQWRPSTGFTAEPGPDQTPGTKYTTLCERGNSSPESRETKSTHHGAQIYHMKHLASICMTSTLKLCLMKTELFGNSCGFLSVVDPLHLVVLFENCIHNWLLLACNTFQDFKKTQNASANFCRKQYLHDSGTF